MNKLLGYRQFKGLTELYKVVIFRTTPSNNITMEYLGRAEYRSGWSYEGWNNINLVTNPLYTNFKLEFIYD